MKHNENRIRARIAIAAVLAGFSLCLSPGVRAEGSASQTLSILPVAGLFPRVQQDFEGDILRIDLMAVGRGWNYQVKLLTPEGDVLKLYYDATTLNLRRTVGQGQLDYGDIGSSVNSALATDDASGTNGDSDSGSGGSGGGGGGDDDDGGDDGGGDDGKDD